MNGALSHRERCGRRHRNRLARAFHGQLEPLETRRLLSFAPPAVGGDPSVNPADFRVTEFATGLDFPTGLLAMPDGSILASINVPTDPSNPNYYSTTGEIVRFTDSTGTGVADTAGTVLYSNLPGPITDLQQAGPYIIVSTIAGQLSFLHTGAAANSPLTFAGSINLAIPSGWEHQTYGLAVRPTPGVAGSYDVLFNIGSESNGIEEDSNGNILYDSNGIAIPEPTTGTIPVSGLITGTLNGDSIYMVQMRDNNGTPAVTNLKQVAYGLRNAASMAFDSAGDLYLADNGIDGTDGGYYGFSTDTLQMISAADLGTTDPNFGFPYSYTLTNQAPGEPVVAVNPSERVTPLASFEPLVDANLPGTGSRSQGAAGFALSPPMFPPGLNDGVFIGFHGYFDAGGTSNDKNPMLFVNPSTGSYFDFISNDEPNIGHLDGATSTENALFVSDIASNGQLWGSPSPGVIYEIEAINHSPVLATIPSQSVAAGQTVSVPITATDPDAGQTLTYSLISALPGAQINPTTGLFTWTPAVGTPTDLVTVEVTDDGLPPMSDTEQFQISVTGTAPVIAAIPVQSVTAGSPLTVQISATAPGQALTYSVTDTDPSGAQINPTTGLFTWTPPPGAASAWITVIATANGSSALTTTAEFHVNVNPVAPVITTQTPTSTTPQITLGPEIEATRPKTIKDQASFTAPANTSWTATVSYGDGSKTKRLALQSNDTFLLIHDYKRKGLFTLTVTLTETTGQSQSASLLVEIGKKKPTRAVAAFPARRR